MWQEISWHFRDSLEGSVFLLATCALLLILSPAFYKILKDMLARRRREATLISQLNSSSLSHAEKKLVVRAIHEQSPGNPEAILQDPRLFNRWVDKLPEILEPPAELVEQLAHIREELFRDVFVVPPLRSTRDFQPNLFVNICAAQGADTLLPSVLVELDDGELVFRIARKERVFEYQPGDVLLLHVPHPEAMYIAKVKVRALSADRRQVTVTHSSTGDFQVRQYREFWRVDLTMGVHFQLIDKDGEAQPGREGTWDGKLINLSGGGAAMVSEQKVIRGDHVRFPLYLADRILNPVVAKVLEAAELPSGKYRSHMMFIGLTPEERDQIIRSLFQWQRERLQTQTREDHA